MSRKSKNFPLNTFIDLARWIILLSLKPEKSIFQRNDVVFFMSLIRIELQVMEPSPPFYLCGIFEKVFPEMLSMETNRAFKGFNFS